MVTITAPRNPGTDDETTPGWLQRVWNTPAASWTRVVLLFLAVATVTHVPSFLRAFWNPDEDWVSDEAGSHALYWTEERIIGGGDPGAS